MNRGLEAEIDLAALGHNLDLVNRITHRRLVIAVVKADAYGHGSVEVSKRLLAKGASCLAVAFTGEAKKLREAGIEAPIIVLFDRFDVEDFFLYRLTPVIQDAIMAEEFSMAALARNVKIPAHLKVDTGMGRVGLSAKRAVDEAAGIAVMKGLHIAGIMSHFSEADLLDRSYALHQLKLFEEIRGRIAESIGRPIPAHIANSAAVLTFGESHLDLVRPGLLLYGCSPFPDNYGLKPVMKVKTRVLALRKLAPGCPVSYGRTFVTQRESLIAVIAAGYADGYDRLFSSNSQMLIKGRRVPVVGRVCMDLTMADVTGVAAVREGDEVVLLGRQGDEEITAGELAARINTIPYEILISLGARARKVYSG